MSDSNLMPDKIKSPIQLMAAWFVMLVSVITVLLTTAVNIEKPDWAAGYLVVSATVAIIVVIGCVLLMLTRYRPHLQDGKEYAEWIKDQGAYSQGVQLEPNTATLSADEDTATELRVETSDINNISVSVIDIMGATDIVESLKNKGFNAEIFSYHHKEFDRRESLNTIRGEQEGIWVGARVEPDIAIRAIKIALRVWPDLKYVVIPSDNSNPPDHVNDQIFIGGSSKTPIKRGTRPWTLKELKSLRENTNIDDFHSKIRGKYS